MSDRKNHRRDARRSVQKLNRAGVKPATTVATFVASWPIWLRVFEPRRSHTRRARAWSKCR